MDLLLIAGGFIALLIGGETLVSGAVAIARRLHIPPMVIGLTLVGFGTSTPELLTSVHAALIGAPGVAVGNVVGSNIANILLILGLAALLWPISVNARRFRNDALFLLGAAILAAALMAQGQIGLTAGVLMLAGLAVFLLVTFRSQGQHDHAPQDDTPLRPTWQGLALFVFGLAVTLLGARWLVSGAVGLAQAMGVSDTLIGLTVVAVGTSLPELVTSVVAARRQHSDVAFGNIVGSNIFNIFGILGVTAVIKPMPVPETILHLDMWVMLAATGALIAAAVTGRGVSRREGALLLAGYGAYLAVLIAQAL